MQSLSPEARARLAEFQRDESPDAAAEARVLAAIERRIAEPAPVRRRAAVQVVTLLALAAALLLAIRWAIAPAHHSGDPAAQAPYQDDPRSSGTVRQPPVAAPVITPEPAVVPVIGAADAPDPAPPTVAAGPVSPVPPVTSPRRPRTRDGADDIAAEVALLREAKLAAPARRLELLGEHARRFPAGAFAAERSLLEVETRCALGQVDEARALAARFARKFPGSALASRVAKICNDDP